MGINQQWGGLTSTSSSPQQPVTDAQTRTIVTIAFVPHLSLCHPAHTQGTGSWFFCFGSDIQHWEPLGMTGQRNPIGVTFPVRLHRLLHPVIPILSFTSCQELIRLLEKERQLCRRQVWKRKGLNGQSDLMWFVSMVTILGACLGWKVVWTWSSLGRWNNV